MTKTYKNIFGNAVSKDGIVIGASIIPIRDGNKYKHKFRLTITVTIHGTTIKKDWSIPLTAIERESMSNVPETEARCLEGLIKDGFTEDQSFLIGAACLEYMENTKGNLTKDAIDEVFNAAMDLDSNLYKP